MGSSPFADRARRVVHLLARAREPLVLIGERGSGKAFLAAHIHAESSLAAPLETLNCSIASERTRRLELFGGEPPELTTSKRSLLELPTTVVLKHLDEAGPFLQDTLVAALRTGLVVRLRGTEPHPVLARVILTFRKPPRLLFRAGAITEGLSLYVQRCRTLHVPPLRQRPEDVLPLAEYYHDHFERRLVGAAGSRGRPALRPGLERFLVHQEWEDNVRDLVAYVRSLTMFALEEEIVQREKLELMKMLTLLEQGNEFSLERSMAAIRRSIIERAVRHSGGHQGRSAEILGLSDREIRRKRNG